MKLLLRHGWALDRTLWDGVLAALDADADGGDVCVVDAGYYGRPAAPPVAGERMLGVGHPELGGRSVANNTPKANHQSLAGQAAPAAAQAAPTRPLRKASQA